MGRTYEQIDGRLATFLKAQPVFFVATAPVDVDGHVNLSPKGIAGTFAIIDPLRVAYLDLTGSGVETIAHVRENARITLMFCAFTGPPRVVRLYGRGEVLLPADAHFEALVTHFPALDGVRSIVVARLDRIADSCGYGVPQMTLTGDRSQLWRSYEQKGGEAGLVEYRTEKNSVSIDGLDGLPLSQP